MSQRREVWVTGIGLVTSHGEGVASHLALLDEPAATPPRIEAQAFAPTPVHPLVQIDVAKQIPKSSEQRQMGVWQRTGVYAGGLAIADAAIAGKPEILGRTDLVVAAGNGERDLACDQKVLETITASQTPGPALNEALSKSLRPTLYLGELSNLLAGNIQIVHGVTGSSRTLKGEEACGVSAVEDATRRIAAGTSDIALVGGALNAERLDLLLNYELGGNLWAGEHRAVWERRAAGGGMVLGSMGAFLVLEARAHAEARGAIPYARIAAVATDRSRRQPGAAREATARLLHAACGKLPGGPLPVLSGASGVEPVTAEEREFLDGLSAIGLEPAIRAYGSRLGHGVEAHFPLGVALAALALRTGRFYAPFDNSGFEKPLDGVPERVLVTGLGHWRGEGLALVERAN